MTEQEKTLEAIAELQRQLALKEAADNAALDGSDASDVPPTMDFVTRARLLAQGATLGFADELIARARSLSPNETYDEAVSDERSALEKSREQFPVQSIAYEIGGALVPGLLAAPFTGGTSLAPAVGRAAALTTARVAPKVLRAAGVGAAEGAVYAVGAGDEKATKSDVFSDALTGAIVNPAAQKAFALAAGTLKAVVRPFFKGKRAKAVEDEVMRIVSSTGQPVEVIIDRVRNGEIIADMSDVVMEELRGIYAKGGKGAQVINDRLRDRSGRLREETVDQLQIDLAPNAPEGNIQMAINTKTKALEKAESDAYDAIFADSVPMGQNSVTAVSSTVRDALQDFPQLRSMVNEILKAKRLPPVFLVKDKKVELVRALDLETVEVIRRALKDKTTQAFDSKSGTLAGAFDAREKELRKFIDEYSPELAATRAKWAAIQAAKGGFDDGKKVFSMSPDDAEIYFEEISNPEVLEAFRAGVASAIRRKGGAGSRQGLVMKLDDIRSNERAILEKIYPGETLEAIVEQINRSRQAFTTEGRVVRGAQTAFTEEAITRQGAAGAANDVLDILTAGVVGKTKAAMRLVRRGLGKQAEMLSEDQLEQVAQMLVEENADVLEAAINGRISREALSERLSIWTNRIASTLGAGATQQAIQNDISLDNLISSATAGEMPQVDLPDPYGTDNPLLYDQETGESYLNQSPALKSLIETTNPSVLNEAR